MRKPHYLLTALKDKLRHRGREILMAEVRGSSVPIGELIREAIDQLDTEDFNIYLTAVGRLVKLGPSAAKVIAERLMYVGATARTARRFVNVLEKMGPLAAPSARALVMLLLKDKGPTHVDDFYASNVSKAIVSIGPAADYVMPDLLQAFASASDVLRALLIKTMRGIGTRANAVIPLLLAALERSASDEKSEILWTLGDYGHGAIAARGQVEQILKDDLEDEKIRIAAAYALGSIAPDVGTQILLLQLLESELKKPSQNSLSYREEKLPDSLAIALSRIQGALPIVSTRIHHVLELLDRQLPVRAEYYHTVQFNYSIHAFVELVVAHAPTTEIAVELLRRLYLVGCSRLIDRGSRRSPLVALARLGEAAADVLVELAALGDSEAVRVLEEPFVDRNFALATIRRILGEHLGEDRGEAPYSEIAARMLYNLQPTDFELLEQLALHPNQKVRDEAETARKRVQAASQDRLQVRVIHPTEVPPNVWRNLTVIVHSTDVFFHVESVVGRRLRKAASQLRATRSIKFTADTSSQLTIVPVIPGFDINPSQITFARSESIYEFDFRIRTSEATELDVAANGRVLLYRELLLVAEVPTSIFVNSALEQECEDQVFVVDAKTFDTVFVSYAREDIDVVKKVERVSSVLGTRFLRDTRDIKSGTKWQDEINEMINAADVFQLFWSKSSKSSKNVESEWRSALALERDAFIRPCYWEVPMPEPPKELAHINFAFLRMGEQPAVG